MEFMDVEKLKPHSKNRYFFDDMDGEPWTAFLESIETSGIIEPIIVTQDLTIVSGHQRVRAAKKLGIKEVAVEMRNYDTEDEVLKQLIEANVRQRGIANTNEIKFGRCVDELKRIYGIANGGDRKSEKIRGENLSSDPHTIQELADSLNVSVDDIKKASRLSKCQPEIQQLVEDGTITAYTAQKVIASLAEDEQRKIAEQIVGSGKEKVSGQEVKFYKDRIQKLTEENAELRNKKPEVREVIREVIPEDYEKTKTDFESYKKDYQRMVNERQTAVNEAIEVKRKLREMEKGMADAKSQLRLEEDSEYFAIRVYDFIKQNGGYVWIFDKINELPEDKRQNFVKAIYALDAYTKQMIENIGGYGIE